MTCSWKYEHYGYCIQQAKEQGYFIVPLKDVQSVSEGDRFIILRHDIERSISRALGMARMEKDMGVRSTYFVRVHAATYNIFEYNTYIALREINSLGHEIGLHFEVMDFAEITEENPREIFLREKRVLEMVLSTPVLSAAAHGEHTSAGINHNRSFFENFTKEDVDICYNAYDLAFTKDIKYISDSFGFWREGCMCNHIGKHRRMQILVHPCWWYKDHLFE